MSSIGAGCVAACAWPASVLRMSGSVITMISCWKACVREAAEGCVCMQSGEDIWGGSTAIVVAVGPSSDELRYLKSVALHLWLFGYELPGWWLFICQLA